MIQQTALLALVTLINVFSQAFQSQAVNRRLRTWALFGSTFIGLSNVFVWRVTTNANTGPWGIAVYVVAGAIGCQLAMSAHGFIKDQKK